MVAQRGIGQPIRSVVRIPGSGSDINADPVLLDLSNVSSLAAMVPVPQRLPRNLYRSSSSKSTDVKNTYEDKLTNTTVKPISKETPAENKPKAAKERKRSLPEEAKEVNEALCLPAPKVARIELKVQVPAVGDSKETHQQILILPSSSGAVIELPLQQITTDISPDQQHSQVANLSLSIVVPQLNQLKTNTEPPRSCPPQMRSIINGGSAPATPLQQREMPQSASTSSTTQAYHYPVSCDILQEVNKLKKEKEALMERLTKFQNIFKSKQSLQFIAKRLAESSAQT